VLGDSNNPKPEGLGYGKSQDFGLNLTAMAFTPLLTLCDSILIFFGRNKFLVSG